MRVIAIALLATVFVRHGAIYSLADMGDFSPAAVSYMLGGAEEMMLALVIAVLLLAYQGTLWRNLALGACAIAALEGAQMTVCRLAIADMQDVPARTNLCDHLAGFPLGYVIFTLYLLIVCYAAGTTLRKR